MGLNIIFYLLMLQFFVRFVHFAYFWEINLNRLLKIFSCTPKQQYEILQFLFVWKVPCRNRVLYKSTSK